MRFTLTIELGNDAMRNGDDVAECLNRAADKLWDAAPTLAPGESGRMLDVNGNTVGSWDVSCALCREIPCGCQSST